MAADAAREGAGGDSERKAASSAPVGFVVQQPERRHMQQCSRLVAQAFCGKFAHVGMSQEQAAALEVENLRRNWDLLAPHMGVVIDDHDRVLGQCHLKFHGTPALEEVPDSFMCNLLGCCGALRLAKLAPLEGHTVASGECYIAHIAVSAEARGKGIGGTLMRWADKTAVERGCKRLALDVATSNRALHLYQRQGYVITSKPCCCGCCCCCIYCLVGEKGFYTMHKTLPPVAASGLP